MTNHLPCISTHLCVDNQQNKHTNTANAKAVLLARKIEKQMRRRNLSKQQFASLMDVQPSIITRWLSGSHNFTINTLFEIEQKLQLRLVDIGPDLSSHIPHVYLHLSVESATTSLNNPEELIGAMNRFFKIGVKSNHCTSSEFEGLDFSAKPSQFWHL